jgi:hypothetical protein
MISDLEANRGRSNVKSSPPPSIQKGSELATRYYDSDYEDQRSLHTIPEELSRSRTCRRPSQIWRLGMRRKRNEKNISRCKT